MDTYTSVGEGAEHDARANENAETSVSWSRSLVRPESAGFGLWAKWDATREGRWARKSGKLDELRWNVEVIEKAAVGLV